MEHAQELVVRQAALALGGKPILRDVDLELARGEVVALLGASGCGKTTLLRSIAGLATLDAGRIAIGGRDVTRASAQERGVGVVFQHYALFPNLSVRENIEFGLRAAGISRTEATERAESLLQLVELEAHRDTRPARLSGGQRQRVALARALARKPSLLLMDEPFSALDESFRVPLRRSFRRLQRQLQQTCLVVTHDRAEAFELADRVAVMFDGRIAQCDTPGPPFGASPPRARWPPSSARSTCSTPPPRPARCAATPAGGRCRWTRYACAPMPTPTACACAPA